MAHSGGAAVVSGSFLKTNGSKGTCIKYNTAVKTARRLHLSAAFSRACPQLDELVRSACASSGSHWRIVSRDTFLACRSGWAGVALVAKADKDLLQSRPRTAMIASVFLKWCSTIDKTMSVMGMCSR